MQVVGSVQRIVETELGPELLVPIAQVSLLCRDVTLRFGQFTSQTEAVILMHSGSRLRGAELPAN